MYIVWYTLLVSAICLEGLGRRYLPGIPSMFFYFLKDAVLVFGYFSFPPPPSVRRAVRYLYGGFGVILVAGVVWTAIELANPRQQSWMLALIGFRAYWLWWIAPPLVAGFLQDEKRKRQAINVLVAHRHRDLGVGGLPVRFAGGLGPQSLFGGRRTKRFTHRTRRSWPRPGEPESPRRSPF